MALWPNSDVNTGSITGSVTLPARSRATAYVSIGNWSQNDPLIPFTINSQLPVIPLDRTTADAKAVVTATNVNVTSRPTSMVWFSVRYRSYDFDNQTPVFHVANTVSYDTTAARYAYGGTIRRQRGPSRHRVRAPEQRQHQLLGRVRLRAGATRSRWG